ncbi:MAG: hypothetical protein ACRDAM_08155 [Casimicrobium sp.]
MKTDNRAMSAGTTSLSPEQQLLILREFGFQFPPPNTFFVQYGDEPIARFGSEGEACQRILDLCQTNGRASIAGEIEQVLASGSLTLFDGSDLTKQSSPWQFATAVAALYCPEICASAYDQDERHIAAPDASH